MNYSLNKESECGKVRYILGSSMDCPTKTIICIGVNPSTATPQKLDPTLKKVESIIINNGYTELIMCNLYPQRATNPNNLHMDLDTNLKLENNKQIKYLFQKGINSVWCAWGNLIDKREYLNGCMREIIEIGKNYDISWYATSVNKTGHPSHPLYEKSNSILSPFAW